MLLSQGRNELGVGKNVHSLERERVNGVVMNTDAWYDLFDVKPGDKLYRKPEERVHIWWKSEIIITFLSAPDCVNGVWKSVAQTGFLNQNS